MLFLVAFSLQILAGQAKAEMLSGGQMDGPFRNGLAQGWVSNCYGFNEVTFAEESSDVHGGKAAQRVTCSHFDSGGVQFHSADVAVEKGKPYTLTLWMKGDVKAPVYVGIRKHGAPYTPYLKRDLRVRKDWTPYLIIGQASDTDPRCGIYIMFAGTGTLLVDDVSLEPGIHEDAILEADGPMQKGNRVYNSSFEAGSEGWTSGRVCLGPGGRPFRPIQRALGCRPISGCAWGH